MRVLVAGLGSIGMRHARNLRHLGITDLAGFDPAPERRQAFAAETSGKTFDTLESGLAQRPALTVIASPNVFHLPQAIAAAQAGSAMLIEKPLGTDLAQAETLQAICKARGLYVHVGSNWKFHSAFIAMKQAIDGGLLGRMTGLQVIAGQWLPDWHPNEDFRRSYSARTDLGGGAIFDTHELDYVQWLAGPITELVGLKAHSGSLPIETEDVAGCVMRLANGALGTLLTDYIQRSRRRRYHLSGDRGTLEWDFQSGTLLKHPAGGAAETIDVDEKDLNLMYVQQSRRILDDIKSGGSPPTSLDHMIGVLRLQLKWHAETLSQVVPP